MKPAFLYRFFQGKFLILVFIFLFLQFFQKSFSQKSLPFYRISTAQGLSQSTVFCSFQDSRGYIWFGTSEGLNRYDGYDFKVFRHILNDSTSLKSNDIVAINEDAEGNIWVGTRTRGISILNKNTLKFDNSIKKHGTVNLETVGISTISKDKYHNIWFTTEGQGLYLVENTTKKIRKITIHENALAYIVSTFIDENGHIWYGNDQMQIIKFESENKIKLFNLSDRKSNQKTLISGITKAASGNIYISTNYEGLFELNEYSKQTKNVFYRQNIFGNENNMKAVVRDKENNIYIPTNNGLLIVTDENFEDIYHQKAISTKRFAISTHALMSILIDKNGNLWIGTWEGGINVFYKKPPPFSLLRHEVGEKNGPLERKITSVATTNDKIWLGTNIGLSIFDRKQQSWNHFFENSLSGVDINSLKYDADGDLFISAYLKKLNIYFSKSNQFKQFDLVNFKSNSSISTFAQEITGKMWIGTKSDGLILFDKKTGQSEALSKKFPSLKWTASISAIFHDKKNRLWVGTVSNGLYMIDFESNKAKVFSNYNGKNKISDEHIISILQDSKNRIWIGTNGGGLNLYQEKSQSFTTISEKDGLPNNTIKAIIEDVNGSIWVSTNQGICQYNPSTHKFMAFNEPDGLQGKEFGRGVAAMNKNGELFFGGTNGLSFFHPNELNLKASHAPNIIFSDLKLFNKTVEINAENSPLKRDISLSNEITLKNNQSVFTIDFLALDFQQLKNYQYAFKLEGFDTDWNFIGTKRSATYTNMPEGNYTLKVKSTNNEGIWTNNIASLKIKILPPWYRTIFAYLFYLALLVSTLYLWRKIIKVRERLQSDIRIQRIEAQKIKELDIAKTNFFTNISHEFRTPLTLIISPIQQLMIKMDISADELQNQHNIILKNAQRLLRLINQILDISKIEAGNMKLEVSKNDLVEFLTTIAISFKVLAQNKNIEYSIKVSKSRSYCYFDKDIIEKITYNLLSNAFKFTKENGKVDFIVAINNQKLIMEVIDNGIGMNSETLEHIFERYFQADGKKERKSIGTGIGLALTKELIELHQGSIHVDSQLNHGSHFKIEIPISMEQFDINQIKENFDFHFDSSENMMSPSKQPNTEIELENKAPLLLITEDNDELREYLSGIFAQKYKVIEAENGAVGFELALEHLPDIILSDFMMPMMDGGEFCKAIKTNEKTSHIPFVILTSRQNTSTINSSYDLGADDYVIKPFNITILSKKLENIIRSRSILKNKFGKAENLIPENILQNETEEKFFKKVVAIIETNLEDSSFDVADLEAELNMSKMQLYRKLKGVSNLAPNEFIRNIRLKNASLIMQNTMLNISEIAYAVGFNDPAYFARCFRKEFGKSPTDFMNRKAV